MFERYAYDEEYGRFIPDMDEYYEKPTKRKCCVKCLKWSSLAFIVILVILFLLVFVVLPLVVMCSISVQTFIVFLNVDQPKDPEYNNFGKYGANGTRNLYVGVKDFYNEKTNINLGVWHLVPENLIPATNNPNFDYDESLLNSRYPVVIYFHGQAATRIQALPTYLVLRKYFHVIVFDYRNYGDSTEAQLSEVAVVNDGIQFYNWLMTKTHSDIYVWGHSLGCGISTHTVARLKDYNIVPKGLVLEAPFSNLQDEVYNHPIAKIFTWLPWFKATISDPLEQNGFIFDNTKNIIKVDCPILIMNSQDDPVIPYKLGKKLAKIATTKRDPINQGSVTYHLFPAHFGYNHVLLTSDEHIPQYIEEFLYETRSLK